MLSRKERLQERGRNGRGDCCSGYHGVEEGTTPPTAKDRSAQLGRYSNSAMEGTTELMRKERPVTWGRSYRTNREQASFRMRKERSL